MVLQQKEQILQNSSPPSTIVLPVRLLNHSFYGECTYLRNIIIIGHSPGSG